MAAFNGHNAERLAACYSEDAIHYNPIVPEPVRGRQAIQEFTAGFFDAFPDATVEFQRVLVESDRAAVESVIRGTHQGTLMGAGQALPATGNRVEIEGICLWEIAPDGRISSDTARFNPLAFLQRVGAMPAAA